MFREKSGKTEISVMTKGDLATLECKKTLVAGALPQTPLGELTALPGYPSWWELGRGLVALFLRTPSSLLTIALNMSINLCLLYWKSRGISCDLESGHPVCDVSRERTVGARRSWHCYETTSCSLPTPATRAACCVATAKQSTCPTTTSLKTRMSRNAS